MARMTVLAVAVMCDGRLFPAGASIDDIPRGNRESVRLRFCEDIDVPDRPTKPAKAKADSPDKAEAKVKADPPDSKAAETVDPSTTTTVENQAPSAQSPDASADEQPASSTPLPAMSEELLVLLKAGGIVTVEQAKEYLAKNKTFRPLKGVGEAKDIEIRAALGLA